MSNASARFRDGTGKKYQGGGNNIKQSKKNA